MKRMRYLLLLLAACCLLATAAAAAGDAAESEDGDIAVPLGSWCDYCETYTDWEDFYGEFASEPGHYHYALTESVSVGALCVPEGATVCLDLQGCSLTADSGPVRVCAGAIINLMDSSEQQTGYLCSAGNGDALLGTVAVQPDGELNLCGGCIKGGTYRDGTAVSCGAAVTVSGNGRVSVSGGQVVSALSSQGDKGPCVYVADADGQIILSGSGRVEDIFFASENGQLAVLDGYTGTANIGYPATVVLWANRVVGRAYGANLSGGAITCGVEWQLGVAEEQLVLLPSAQAVVYNTSGALKCETLQKAVDACTDGYVKLLKPTSEHVTLQRDTYLDINGQSVTVTVETGVTLYGMDSQTDDYTVADAAGYGRLTVMGGGEVLGMPEEAGFREHGYLKITEADGISFHAVNLKLTAMTLRAEEAGVYYKSSFAGDEKVAAYVRSFGVALSVKRIPDAENLETYCKYSVLDMDFAAGGMDADAASTLLKRVMKPSNAELINHRNANLPVYGRAYILTDDGYMFGAVAKRSFKEQVEGADAIWTSLTEGQKAAMVQMYTVYETVMKSWNVPNVINQAKNAG